MVLIDAVENARRVDLLNGKSGGLLDRWAHLKSPRTRKSMVVGFSDRAEYRIHDFLKPSAPNNETVFRPRSSLSETKFHRGFTRKSFPNHGSERYDIDERAWLRFNQRTAEAIAAYQAHKSNLITGDNIYEARARGRKTGHSLAHQFDADRLREAARRIVNSDGRFFANPRSPETAPNFACKSVILGYFGERKRARTTSVGIFDNFTHTQKPMDSPPPTTCRRNLSQIILG